MQLVDRERKVGEEQRRMKRPIHGVDYAGVISGITQVRSKLSVCRPERHAVTLNLLSTSLLVLTQTHDYEMGRTIRIWPYARRAGQWLCCANDLVFSICHNRMCPWLRLISNADDITFRR